MNVYLKYLVCVSAVLAVLTGCEKKESDAAQKEVEIEVIKPKVVDIPMTDCEDVALKNRVVNLVREELQTQAIAAFADAQNIDALTQQLRARVVGMEIDLQNITASNDTCKAQLHIVLPNEEVMAADRTFGAAGVASLQDQAIKNNISLMGGNRLVADFAFKATGGNLVIDKTAPVITLASETMATAVRSMSRQNQANAKRETARIGHTNNNLVPAPTVQIRPVELPAIPEVASEQTDGEVATAKHTNTKAPAEQKTEIKPVKSQPKTNEEVEQTAVKQVAKPATPKSEKSEKNDVPTAPAKPAKNEITIVETNDTY